jgi:DNA-directed RNA polymerase specialized sigma24 family protein
MSQSTSRGDVVEDERTTRYREFVRVAEPKLRRSFVAIYGPDRGRDATCEALGYAWQHWDRVEEMTNSVGYLYRVGQSRTAPVRKRPLFERPEGREPMVEPALARAVAALSERQRLAVLLVHSAGWTAGEVAELIGVSSSTVQRHLDRGLAKLRRQIGGDDDGRPRRRVARHPAAPAS